MFSFIRIHDHRGDCRGFVCSRDREDWRIFLEALDTDDGERLIRTLDAEAHARIAVLQGVAVGESHRGRNVGRQLVEQFLRVAAADAVVVAAGKPARTFFGLFGFAPYGSTGLMVLKPAERVHDERRAA